MFKVYSKSCEYVLRVFAELLPENVTQRFSLKELCVKAGVPEAFVRKSFQGLVKKGILKAVSGPGGGYIFTCSPEETSLLDVVYAIEGDNVFDSCIMGLPECGCEQPCPMHESWEPVKKQLLEELGARTIQDLMLVHEG